MRIFLLLLFILSFFLAGFAGATDRVDINIASLEELDTLAGIGPKYAQAIIDGRPYSSLDDLLQVKGIGEKTLQKIKEQGLACVNCSMQNSNIQIPISNQVPNPNNQNIKTTDTDNQSEVGSRTIYSDGIIFSEILPSPAGPDETEEFFELQNINNFEVDLSGWQIKDINGTTTTFTISAGVSINANNFLVFKRPETKIMLNNDEDGLVLINPEEKTIDSVSFLKAPTGQSYSKNNSTWEWSTTLTPEITNIINKPVTKTTLPKTKKSGNNIVEAKDLNAALSQLDNINNPWPLFFTTLFIAIILGIITLFIKLKLQKNVRT